MIGLDKGPPNELVESPAAKTVNHDRVSHGVRTPNLILQMQQSVGNAATACFIRQQARSKPITIQRDFWDYSRSERVQGEPDPLRWRSVRDEKLQAGEDLSDWDSLDPFVPITYTRTTGDNPDEANRGEATPPSLFVEPGTSTQSRRTPSARMLDRMARRMMRNVGGDFMTQREVGTPHIALTLIGDKVFVAGNTNWTKDKREEALARLTRKLTIQIPENDSDPLKKRAAKDERKFSALKAQAYWAEAYSANLPRIDEEETRRLAIIREAIQDGRISFVDTGKTRKWAIHGEMQLLNDAMAEMIEHPNPTPARKSWSIGGRKRDCLACHWAFALFNQYIANPHGYDVHSGGTHGRLFGGWKMPDWMTSQQDIRTAMETQVTDYAAGWRFLENGVLRGGDGQGGAPLPRGADNPEESDSDVDVQ